jgi:hypothetical protein
MENIVNELEQYTINKYFNIYDEKKIILKKGARYVRIILDLHDKVIRIEYLGKFVRSVKIKNILETDTITFDGIYEEENNKRFVQIEQFCYNFFPNNMPVKTNYILYELEHEITCDKFMDIINSVIINFDKTINCKIEQKNNYISVVKT